MSYTSINGHITKDFPDGDYVYQAGPDSEENRLLADQRLKANGCKTVRFETRETVLDQPDAEPIVMLYAHGYLTERHFAAMQ